jgi:NTP pyrophosphatase (non-canonical NTP hydrolase)
VRAVAVLAAVRVRDAVGMRLGWRDGEEATDALIVEMTGEVASAINARSLAG